MRWPQELPPEKLFHMTLWTALGIVIVAIAMVVASVKGQFLSEFEEDESHYLASDENIRGWVSLDKQSYLIGDIVRYRVKLLWREDQVRPDLASFETSINFYPLDYVSYRKTERAHSGRVHEYVADYVLHAINIDVPSTNALDTVTVYYTIVDDATRTVYPFRANAPPVYFGEYYPPDVSDIELLAPRPPISAAVSLRRILMIVCATFLFMLSATLLWAYGRRRTELQLSAAETLWRKLGQERPDLTVSKVTELRYEKFMTEALELRTGISAAAFWTHSSDTNDEWHDELTSSRRLLGGVYRPEGALPESLDRVEELIRSLLRPIVDAARLERESIAHPWQRLRQHRDVLFAGGGMLIAALCALLLAASPSFWMPHGVQLFNDASVAFATTGDVEQAIDDFARIAETAKESRAEAASLYNLGTLMASPLRSRMSRDQHRNFLHAIFMRSVSLNRFLHDVELETEAELLTLMSEVTRQYVQAEQVMRAAARAGPGDVLINRNLELLGKIRRAIGRSIQQLISEAESQSGGEQLMGQSVIDLKLLMETELPDEFSKTDDGKDDRSYYIMERF